MSGLSLPVNRNTGRALVVASPGNRARPLEVLHDLGFVSTTEADEPFAAMAELCRRPLVYRAVILSLASLYREELAIIPSIKTRFPHIELWIAHSDGRQSALAEAMRLGADGLLAEDGLHRIAGEPKPTPVAPAVEETPVEATEPIAPTEQFATDPETVVASNDPMLTPDELRALLHEQSSAQREEQ